MSNTIKKDLSWYRQHFHNLFIERITELSKINKNGKDMYYMVNSLTGKYSNIGFDSIIFKAKNKYELWLKINDFEYKDIKYSNILWDDFDNEYDAYDYTNKTNDEIIDHLINYEINARECNFYNELELHWTKIHLVI